MNQLSQQIVDNAVQLDERNAVLESKFTEMSSELAAAMVIRKPVVYAGLEKNHLFLVDKKIALQWIQPGNTGNTGGGSGAAHGTCSWVTGDITLIGIAPKNIAPKSDDFFFYSVLPYPEVAPNRMRWSVGNFAAKSAMDWGKSQQMEWQKEEFRDGFQYTCGWAVNPRTGLNYWAGAEKWKPFGAGAVVKSMIGHTSIMAEFSLDHTLHTYTYDWIVINGVKMDVGVSVPALPAAVGRKEYSIGVQLDGQASAPAYSAVLDNLVAEWQ